MTRFLTSDFVLSPDRGFVEKQVLELDESGIILNIFDKGDRPKLSADYYPGILVPGFVNAHCHLELSHLRGLFETGTKLIPFLKSVVQRREADPDFIQECIQKADAEMQQEGIVAVGDICNKTDTLLCKSKSQIYYHSFVECFDFFEEQRADDFFAQYAEVYRQFGNLPKSLVPHAPYSVSPRLFELIDHANEPQPILSIHNQETAAEDALFAERDPAFLDFFKTFGFHMHAFQATGKPSVYYTMAQLKNIGNLLMVHNTLSRKEIIHDVLQWHESTYFVTCPNANLFIENTLPDYSQFETEKMCIGTDSLSSNWQLSILEEIKTIQKYQSYLPLDQLFYWATINGAKALNIEKQFGSFSINKKPGINWIKDVQKVNNQLKLSPNASVWKIL